MPNIIWRLWMWWSGQTYPDFRGDILCNPFGRAYAYSPEEMYISWTRNGEFVNYGKWPPLVGKS